MAEYAGVCPQEKAFRQFFGTTEFTQGGRTIATGPCEQCGATMIVVLSDK